MAHEFKIMNTTGTITTYTDYDSIPLSSLLHVISFKPDIGTLVERNEILVEIDTFDSGTTDNFVTEPTLTTIEVELETETSTGGLLLETGDDVSMEDFTFIEERTFTAGDDIVLNGTDSSSTNADSDLILEFADSRHRIVPENFTDGVEIAEDITLATFVRASPSLKSQDGDVRDVTFNNDGTKMFMLGRAGTSDVYEYSVSTAWDVSTITFVRSFEVGVVSATQGDNAANGIEFNTDGTKMFILGQGQDLVNEYALSTGFDLSTASFTQSLDISDQEDLPYGVTFNNDGTKMYITGRRNDNVDEYVLTTGFDISTASHSQTFSVSSQAERASAVRFNSDGTFMYVLEGGTGGVGHNTIYQYTLTTAFDVSTASYSGKSFSVVTEEDKARGFCFGDNEQQLYVCGWRGDDINQYTSAWPKRESGGTNEALDIRSTDGLENHLLLETASADVPDDHYHSPLPEYHVEGDGHTEEEHREIALWNFKLQKLMTKERTNASSV